MADGPGVSEKPSLPGPQGDREESAATVQLHGRFGMDRPATAMRGQGPIAHFVVRVGTEDFPVIAREELADIAAEIPYDAEVDVIGRLRLYSWKVASELQRTTMVVEATSLLWTAKATPEDVE